MGSHAEMLDWWYKHVDIYSDINESEWFIALIRGTKERSERNENRIYIYFTTEKLAKQCCAEADARNIKHTSPMKLLPDEKYRVDIMMNWKERRPSRIHRNQPQIL